MSQKFCNILVVREAQFSGAEFFADVTRVTNHTRLWDTELAWYSLSAIHQICRGYGGNKQH